MLSNNSFWFGLAGLFFILLGGVGWLRFIHVLRTENRQMSRWEAGELALFIIVVMIGVILILPAIIPGIFSGGA